MLMIKSDKVDYHQLGGYPAAGTRIAGQVSVFLLHESPSLVQLHTTTTTAVQPCRPTHTTQACQAMGRKPQ